MDFYVNFSQITTLPGTTHPVPHPPPSPLPLPLPGVASSTSSPAALEMGEAIEFCILTQRKHCASEG